MLTVVNSMAVLILRVLTVAICYIVLQGLQWQKILTSRYRHFDRTLCLLVSIALGYLVSTWLITIMELVQSMILSQL